MRTKVVQQLHLRAQSTDPPSAAFLPAPPKLLQL